ncbi:thiol-disulfide oxidoreductase DCC family protein [Haoranjiania flava]|uniref:DUF393 domain-containing protein n=1 Tax=Haoranjiania flava TaxID=1856322 RepID=A0AAE3LPG1_9BACT|nr:DUF393 domain-containing protein [Haoranjiania flava]MCU7693435.1 DUF393 domain-containing protein [Haoranjiania flava]
MKNYKAQADKDRHGIIIFDDACVLCNRFAQWIIKGDTRRYFKFISLKAASCNGLLPENYHGNNTVILFEDDKIYTESNAALRIVKQLEGWKKWLYIFIVFPKPLRDALYRFTARNRYRWFGTTTTCSVDSSRLVE